MDKIKKELKESFEEKIKRGLSQEEALSKTLLEKRGLYEKEEFSEAVKEFLEDIAKTYSLENLAEADPLQSLVESIYLEYELLLTKIKEILSKN